MKFRLAAAVTAAITLLTFAPALSGCSASAEYTLNTDEEGNKYYTVSVAGVGSALSGEYEIPAYYGEGASLAPVTEIASEGFAGTSLTKITIPATVTKIGSAAFAYNYSLRSVEFKEGTGITEIPRGAFGYCSALLAVEIPASVTSVGYMAFYNCTSLNSVTVKGELESIGGDSFIYCSSLNEFTFSDNLKQIGDRAFMCSGLKSVNLSGGTEIGYAAFHSCERLKSASLGEGITEIKSGVFGYCPALEEIYLPSTLEKIEGARYVDGTFYCGHAFHGDTALATVHFAGSSEKWESVKSNTDNKTVIEADSKFDNSAILNAYVIFGG